jgi:archaellum component FlaC
VKEIELLKIIFKDSPDILEPLNEIDKENKRLHSIIEEVREYIESFKKIYEGHYPYIDTRHLDLNKILEILDKE